LEINVLTGVETQSTYRCFERQTLMDLLDAKGVTWKYYAHDQYSIWTAPNAVAHIRNGPDWQNVIFPETTVLSDIASAKLPQVSWVIPSGVNSDHANSTSGAGPSWVSSIVNAIGTSAYWKDTAIFITWDDWGGWYDHVPPPKIYTESPFGLGSLGTTDARADDLMDCFDLHQAPTTFLTVPASVSANALGRRSAGDVGSDSD